MNLIYQIRSELSYVKCTWLVVIFIKLSLGELVNC